MRWPRRPPRALGGPSPPRLTKPRWPLPHADPSTPPANRPRRQGCPLPSPLGAIPPSVWTSDLPSHHPFTLPPGRTRRAAPRAVRPGVQARAANRPPAAPHPHSLIQGQAAPGPCPAFRLVAWELRGYATPEPACSCRTTDPHGPWSVRQQGCHRPPCGAARHSPLRPAAPLCLCCLQHAPTSIPPAGVINEPLLAKRP